MTLNRKSLRSSRSTFDRNVLAVLLGLSAVIVVLIMLGDRVGTRVVSFEPIGEARSTDPLVMQFSELMDHDSVVQRLHIDPPIQGDFIWSGLRLVFRPMRPLRTGATYTVSVGKGAASLNDRPVLVDYAYSFTVRPPRLAYLTPIDGSAPTNIWISESNDPATAQQLTFSSMSVNSFDVSPDGRKIAFSENAANNASNIWLLDLDGTGVQQLTDCSDSICTQPIWRPDGAVIAYTRSYVNKDLGSSTIGNTSVRGGLPRVWLLDLSSRPYVTRPLLDDSQILGQAINWSLDGNRVAYFNGDTGDSSVYDFLEDRVISIDNPYSLAGILSPDGRQIVFPKFVQAGTGQSLALHLHIEDLATGQAVDLGSMENAALADTNPVWRPDGQQIVFARRDTANQELKGSQIYVYNLVDGSTQPLVIDPEWTSSAFVWDPSGEQLLIQRFKTVSSDNPAGSSLPEIWSVNLNTKVLTALAVQAVSPRWLP